MMARQMMRKHPTSSEPCKAAIILLRLGAKGGHHLLLEKSACTEFCVVLCNTNLWFNWHDIHPHSKGFDSQREGCPRCRCAPFDRKSKWEFEATHRQDEDSANVDKAEDHPVGLCQLVEVVCARWSLSYPIFRLEYMWVIAESSNKRKCKMVTNRRVRLPRGKGEDPWGEQTGKPWWAI